MLLLTRRKLIKSAAFVACAPAIIPIESFAWTHGTGLPVPPGAAAAGYTKLSYYTNFPNFSRVDIGNTGASGFDWYLKSGNWINANQPWLVQPMCPPPGFRCFADEDPTNLSIISTGIRSAAGSAVSKNNLASACYSATDPRGYAGNVFGGPLGCYYDFRLTIQGAVTPGAGNYAFYSDNIGNLLGTWPNKYCTEIDFPENTSDTSAWFRTIAFDLSTNPVSAVAGGNFNITGLTLSNTPYQWGCLQQPIAQHGGGTGLIRGFLNNVAQGDITYAAGSFEDLGGIEDPRVIFWASPDGPPGAWPNVFNSLAVWTLP